MQPLGGLLAILFCGAAAAAPAMTTSVPGAQQSTTADLSAALPAVAAVATSTAAMHAAAAAVPTAARTVDAVATASLTSEEVLQQAFASSLSAISAVATSFGVRRYSDEVFIFAMSFSTTPKEIAPRASCA